VYERCAGSYTTTPTVTQILATLSYCAFGQAPWRARKGVNFIHESWPPSAGKMVPRSGDFLLPLSAFEMPTFSRTKKRVANRVNQRYDLPIIFKEQKKPLMRFTDQSFALRGFPRFEWTLYHETKVSQSLSNPIQKNFMTYQAQASAGRWVDKVVSYWAT
jgi:hypothetical protein